MPVLIKQSEWDAFLSKHKNDYMIMLRTGRALAEQFARNNSLFYQRYSNAFPVVDEPFEVYEQKFPQDIATILQSEYAQAYHRIHEGISALHTEPTTPNPTAHYQPDPRIELIVFLAKSLLTTWILSPDKPIRPPFSLQQMTLSLNECVAHKLQIQNNANEDVFFPYVTPTELDAYISPAPIEPIPQPPAPVLVTAELQFRCLQALIGLGLALLAIAILTCSPVASVLGIAGAVTSQVSTASAVGSGITFLLVGGIYEMRARYSNTPATSEPPLGLSTPHS